MSTISFASWFDWSITPPLCDGKVIEGVLLGDDARRLLKEQSCTLHMFKEPCKLSFPPPYTIGVYRGIAIGPMKHPGIAVILKKPTLLSIKFP